MAIKLDTLRAELTGGVYIAPERIFIKPDGTLTTDEEEASGGTLLVAKGGEMAAEEAAKHGLVIGMKVDKSKPAEPAPGGVTMEGAPAGAVELPPRTPDKGLPKPSRAIQPKIK